MITNALYSLSKATDFTGRAPMSDRRYRHVDQPARPPNPAGRRRRSPVDRDDRVRRSGRGPAVETDPLEAALPADDTIDEPYVPVRFESRVTELGVFELWCVSSTTSGRWKLEFSEREEPED